MISNPQRKVFLEGEGDAWFVRNEKRTSAEAESFLAGDPSLPLLECLPLADGPATLVVEVGCGQGLRLSALRQRRGWNVTGLDPSRAAVQAAISEGINASVGTAERLPYDDASVDLLIYGFCLCWCDRSDLFQIAAEAHRVLKCSSWLAILDFWSPETRANPYHHRHGYFTFKADLPAMFSWHPAYVVTDHKLRHHRTKAYTDDPEQWVAYTIIRRDDESANPSRLANCD